MKKASLVTLHLCILQILGEGRERLRDLTARF